MMALSRVLPFLFFISLFQKELIGPLLWPARNTCTTLESCESNGSVQLDELSDGRKLLQVCLFGHWSYICTKWPPYYYLDEGVALYQAGCSGATYSSYQPNKVPAYLAGIDCSGLERKLIECRSFTLRNRTCDHKLRVACSSTTLNYLCQNGELQMNTSTNILYICASGTWRTLCPKLWGAAQASVACRQLNPKKTIFEATATTITSLETSVNFFRYYFYCTGEEKNLTDCAINQVDSSLFSGNKVAGVICKAASSSPKPTMITSQNSAPSAAVSWVGGIIIGAVLSAVILLTVIVAVYLWRHKMSDSSTERRVSLNQTNQCYSSVQKPQAYEEFQPNEIDHQPAAAEGVYSYTDHTVNANVYDSVPQSNENPKEDTTMPVVDNTALYSMGKHDNGAYSQHD